MLAWGMGKSYLTHIMPYKFKFIEILDKSQNYPKWGKYPIGYPKLWKSHISPIYGLISSYLLKFQAKFKITPNGVNSGKYPISYPWAWESQILPIFSHISSNLLKF